MTKFEKIALTVATGCMFLMFCGMSLNWPTFLIPVFIAPMFILGFVWIWRRA